MIEYLEALAIDIQDAVDSTSLCEADRVTVTAGEPPAPSGECSAIYIWAQRLEDRLSFDENECRVATRATIAYRIDVCYEESEQDQTDAKHLDAAECLYGLMSAVWCYLIQRKDEGDFLGLGSCDKVNLDPLITGERQGGTVSATGGVVFDYDC